MNVDRESIRLGLKAALESDEFKSVVSNIYAEKNDLENVAFLNEVYPCLKWAPQTFPCAEIGIPRGTNSNNTSVYVDYTYAVSLYVHDNGSDEERLEQVIERFVRAMQDFFVSRPNLLPFVAECSITVGDEDYSPLTRVTEYSMPFIKSGMLELFIGVRR